MNELQFDAQYLGGWNLTNKAHRKYKCTITAGKYRGRSFFMEVHTRKHKGGTFGASQSFYYWDDETPVFDSAEEMATTKPPGNVVRMTNNP